MKIVVISDIHGNLEALTSLREECDELWVLGDLVNYGPNPSEVVDFVREKASLAVRGNHDHAVAFDADPQCSPPYREMAEATMRYTNSVLSDSQKRFLRDIPVTAERDVDGVAVALCHATPSDPLFAYCPPESPEWEREIELVHSQILLVGHTHLQFIRQVRAQTVVNPGSLGQSKMGKPEARYAVLENGIVELRAFEYPYEETIQKVAALPILSAVRASLSNVLRTGGLPSTTSS